MSELPGTPKFRRRAQSWRESLTPAKTDPTFSKPRSSNVSFCDSPRKVALSPPLTISPTAKRRKNLDRHATVDFFDASSVLDELSSSFATPFKVSFSYPFYSFKTRSSAITPMAPVKSKSRVRLRSPMSPIALFHSAASPKVRLPGPPPPEDD